MTASLPGDPVAALREFVERIDALDPSGSRVGTIEVRVGDRETRLVLRAPTARALVEALAAYHDPRDRGRCSRCGGRRLDQNFVCADCGRPDGVFGELVIERAARYAGDPPGLPAPDREP